MIQKKFGEHKSCAEGCCCHSGNNDALSLEHPEIIREIHREYLEAGADIITTCSFGAQRISQAEYGMQDRIVEMNLAAARLAREEADRLSTPDHPRFVAGSVGPTGKMLSMSDNAEDPAARAITFDQLTDAYTEQMSALIKGGVDALLIETIFDTLNAKAAIVAAQKAMDQVGRKVELMLSLTISDKSGRSLSGQTIEAFVISILHARPLTIGLNCGLGAADLLPYLRRLSKAVGNASYISCHPNAGLPNAMGEYEDTPEVMCQQLIPFFEEQLVNVIGGCCGTTPSHIAAIAKLANNDSSKFRTLEECCESKGLVCCGLEPLFQQEGEFLAVGERCNVAGSRKFLRLIKEKNYEEAIDIARKQVETGAKVIDINMDDGLIDAKEEMSHFMRLIASEPEVAKVPVMLDSSHFEVIEESLKWCQGKCIVNSISLKEGEQKFLDHARTLRQFGAAVIVMAFDEEGQATTYERKIAICQRAYHLLRDKIDFPADDIIFDPNILTVATGMAEHMDYAIDYVRAAKWIHENLPGAHVSGGLSNLSFAFRGNNYIRESMHSVFLNEATNNGMDMAIMNPATAIQFDQIPLSLRLAIQGVLFSRRDEEATELLIAIANEEMAKKSLEKDASSAQSPVPAPIAQVSSLSAKERLGQALIKGDGSHLKADLKEAMQEYGSALKIIEGPLMEGMKEVGRLFGEGKMFLPQVVKTARTMKQAVEILTNDYGLMSNDKNHGTVGKIILATVKGDVHDIGKNIVGVVLTCNGFNVIDLGVMVPPEQIIERAQSEHADIVCLSGLITPSLAEMQTVARMMQEAGLSIPIIVGGATTSEIHTALKIAPLYPNGVVIHANDAAQNPVIVSRLLSPENRDSFIEEIKSTQAQLVGNSEESNQIKEVISGYSTISISAVRPFVDWKYFYRVWRVNAGSPEAESLKHDAESLLDQIQNKDGFCINALETFYKVQRRAEGLFVEDKQICNSEAPIYNNVSDGDDIGLFAVTISKAFIQHIEELKKGIDDYTALLEQSLADRLVEAANQLLSKQLKEKSGWKGMRPAVGYPMWPDLQDNFRLDAIMNYGQIGISLTENGAMYPQASEAGMILKD